MLTSFSSGVYKPWNNLSYIHNCSPTQEWDSSKSSIMIQTLTSEQAAQLPNFHVPQLPKQAELLVFTMELNALMMTGLLIQLH